MNYLFIIYTSAILNVHKYKYRQYLQKKIFTKQHVAPCANWKRWGESGQWSWYNDDQVLVLATNIRCAAVSASIETPASNRWLDSVPSCAKKSVRGGSAGTWTQWDSGSGTLEKSAIGTNSLPCLAMRPGSWTEGRWRRGIWIAGTPKSLRTCCLWSPFAPQWWGSEPSFSCTRDIRNENSLQTPPEALLQE